MKLRRLILPVFAAGLAILMAAGLPGRLATTQAANSTIEVTLLGDAENPAVKGDASATARFVFNDANRQLDYAVTVSGLSADQVTASHIHRGAVGVNGPIIYPLSTVGFTQISGYVTLTEADVADLKAGLLYVNVHSKDNPGGFARAQLFLDAPGGTMKTVQSAIAAWNAGDAKTFLSYWTDSGIKDAFDGATRDEALAELPNFMQNSPLALSQLRNIQIRGTKVTGLLDLLSGISLERTLETFVLEGGTWKIAGEQPSPIDIPSTSTAIDMKLQEFSFVYDRAALTSSTAPVAFRMSNVGMQDHELVLAKIDSKAPLLELFAEPDIPDGVTVLAGSDPVKAGKSTNIVLVSALTPGRYAFVCFLPDTDGTPHAFKGMYSEFNVGP